MSQKYTSFRDIPQFTRPGGYEVDYPIPSLVQWVKRSIQEENLQMEPDFQRGHVWTKSQQIAFVEFLLRGGRSGRILYFNNPSWKTPVRDGGYNDFVCVDGLQRYTALRRFIENEIKVFGSYYLEYTDTLSISLNTIRVNINTLPTKSAVLQWYLEMNSGGTPHAKKEILRVQELLQTELAGGSSHVD